MQRSFYKVKKRSFFNIYLYIYFYIYLYINIEKKNEGWACVIFKRTQRSAFFKRKQKNDAFRMEKNTVPNPGIKP